MDRLEDRVNDIQIRVGKIEAAIEREREMTEEIIRNSNKQTEKISESLDELVKSVNESTKRMELYMYRLDVLESKFSWITRGFVGMVIVFLFDLFKGLL